MITVMETEKLGSFLAQFLGLRSDYFYFACLKIGLLFWFVTGDHPEIYLVEDILLEQTDVARLLPVAKSDKESAVTHFVGKHHTSALVRRRILAFILCFCKGLSVRCLSPMTTLFRCQLCCQRVVNLFCWMLSVYNYIELPFVQYQGFTTQCCNC